MPRALPRFYRELERVEDERRLGRLLLELGEAAPPRSSAGATAAGDERRLRGVPAAEREPFHSPRSHRAALANRG